MKELRVGINDDIESLEKLRTKRELEFDLNLEEFTQLHNDDTTLDLVLSSNIQRDLAMSMRIDYIVPPKLYGIVTGSLILCVLYLFIIFDIVHRTFAAIIASGLSVAALSYVGNRPTMNDTIQSIEAETLLLLFSMMIIVAIVAKTGLFDYAAVFAYKVSYHLCNNIEKMCKYKLRFKITNGKVWPLIHYLCLFAGLLSMILDNVTCVLLLTPIIIRISEVIDLNPNPILIIVMMSCNIAGVGTPMGDPPNIMIISNKYLLNHVEI